jgi:hypothetical protein
VTPEDLVAIRGDAERIHVNSMPDWGSHVRALCDALEQAWAERDNEAELRALVTEQYERAERAELELSEYKDAANRDIDRLTLRAEQVEAEMAFQRKWCLDNLGLIPPTRVQHADLMRALDEIEGGDQ